MCQYSDKCNRCHDRTDGIGIGVLLMFLIGTNERRCLPPCERRCRCQTTCVRTCRCVEPYDPYYERQYGEYPRQNGCFD